MKIYQPMLYVGLGGTGCLIGSELERRLRDELCGPDGTDLQEIMTGENLQPFQLPACLQFVYADLNEAELVRLPRMVAPSAEHRTAVERTQHLVRQLVPSHDTYPEVARSLRTNAIDHVRDWLPPADREPRVAPLPRGAGQLPTVGRAALFETLRHGIGPVCDHIGEAIGRISKSGGQLSQLRGKLGNTCDVFVAFSVAGGTGSGIFYDFLHLIGHTLHRNGFKPQIYPLVLMPSAFDSGLGGGRRALLNSGRALLDLFRLIDDQNGQAALTQLDDFGLVGSMALRYPGSGEVRLRPSTVQTAFLFSRPAGVERDDLHRSVVSLVTSLIATEHDEPAGQSGTERMYQSFADEFINRGVEREIMAASGVGNRGVSTALVASMTVPVDELADIVAARLMSEGISELSNHPAGNAESNRDLIEQCFAAADVEALRTCPPEEFTDVTPAKGLESIERTLRTRSRHMHNSLDTLDRRLDDLAPTMASKFDPRRAIDRLLDEVDLFRLRRVILGDPTLAEPAAKRGFFGVLERRRAEPAAPDGVTVKAPQPQLKGPRLGRLRWSAPGVQRSLKDQDRWYVWRSRRAWHAAWAEQTSRWERPFNAVRRDLSAVVSEFLEYSRHNDVVGFTQRAKELYRPRTGVSYLLPPYGGDLEPFYQATLRRFVACYVAEGRLRATATTGEVFQSIVGADGWRQAYLAGWQRGPEQAVGLIRDRVKQAVKRLFRYHAIGEEPLLPALGDLLAAAANKAVASVGEDDLSQFRHKVAALVPGGFSPQGTGRLKVLISYAASARDREIEDYLARRLNLPNEPNAVTEFRSVDAESIVVVLLRTSMSVTEVPELRGVLRQWSQAVRREEPQDFLPWRQRLGYDFGYLMTTQEHRVRILHRLLCALWNGRVSVIDGVIDSPNRIQVSLGDYQAVSMTLELSRFDRASSWGSLLRAYEEWAIADDDQIRQDFCVQLMNTRPHNLDSAPKPPDDLYRLVRQLATEELDLLNEIEPQLPRGNRNLDRLRGFWSQTFPAALDAPFEAVSNPVRGSLRELEMAVLSR